MVPKDNHDVSVGQRTLEKKYVSVTTWASSFPGSPGIRLMLSIEWHLMLKWSAGISYHISTPLSNANHLKHRNCIMDNHKVHGSMIYLCYGDNFGAQSFISPLNELVRLRGCGSYRNGQSSKLIMVFF